MKKTIFLIILIGCVASLLLYLALSQRSREKTSALPTPTPPQLSPTQTPSKIALTITNTRPGDGEHNVALGSAIVITFNRRLSVGEVIFTIAPVVGAQLTLRDNTLIVTPKSSLAPGTLYTFSISYQGGQKLPDVFTFTTTGPTTPFLPNTQPKGAAEHEERFLRENYPDIYLQRFIPYQSASFSINSEYRLAPTGHYAFLVKSLEDDSSKAKIEVIAWLKSLKLTDQQIEQLDISYQ